ncbi:hypothetical protein H0E84_12560 [Luteimonas sp. SJ-92]|uniref:Uncharacterized protein n=1 Tax=Luteimonas salinisoli TaxID=2752307 RepID=A0A853JEM7_9GAMM|nr:hypothetical protein [Luteimonas salinisoli]NZA27214.1 hypothetical protein [Luteimonas salinisoli]
MKSMLLLVALAIAGCGERPAPAAAAGGAPPQAAEQPAAAWKEALVLPGKEVPEEPQKCFRVGGMSERLCPFQLVELPEIENRTPVAIDNGFLVRSGDGFALASARDGSGTAVPVGALNDQDLSERDVLAMVGRPVSVFGIYHPETGSLDIHSLRWIREPGVPPPDWPQAAQPSQ